VKPEPYKATPARSNRVVLLEMFTGSGCPPCVAADLALDAAMGRYPADSIVALAYHQNIPQPDPMVAANNNDRRLFYSVNGVPTFEVDGVMIAGATGGNMGGGGRDRVPVLFDAYKDKIEKALETPATAGLTVKATGAGDIINVTAKVSKLPADAKDVKLHIVLAERELRFMGENGVRFHPVVVRATAGEMGAGLPVTANGTVTYSFNLATIKSEITSTLAAEMVKRHSGEAPGSTPREYVAEGRPYTAIDGSNLVVVAFLQEGAYVLPPPKAIPNARPIAAPGTAGSSADNSAASGSPVAEPQGANGAGANQSTLTAAHGAILQAAKTDVVYSKPASGKGGSR
jgi:thiol-disulfide isomerase/thioredoxin